MTTTIDLGKLRFLYRGDYSASTIYSYNDVVKNGGNSYIFINATATSGISCANTAYWSPLVEGMSASGAWSSSTAYGINALVRHGGSYYRATDVSTNQEPPNATYWEVFVEGYNHRNAWVTATDYKVGDSAVHEGQSYRALTNHTSGAFLADFLASNWQRYSGGVNDRGSYTVATDYFVGDLASLGAVPNKNIYMCTADHTSHATEDPTGATEGTKWTMWINGQIIGGASINAFAYFTGMSA